MPAENGMWRTIVHLDAGHTFQHGKEVSKAFSESQHCCAVKSVTDELGSHPDAQNTSKPI